MIDWLDQISPVPNYGGSRIFKKGVINPWRIIFDAEIFLFRDGEAKFILDTGDEIPCPGPCYAIIQPGIKHISHCLSKEVMIYWCHFHWVLSDLAVHGARMTFNPDDEEPEVSRYPSFVPGDILYGLIKDEYVFELHNRLCEALASNNLRCRKTSRAILLRELLELLIPVKDKRVYHNREDAIADRIRELLDEIARQSFAKAMPIKNAITGSGMSYFHQERIFKRRFGVTPTQYVNAVRVERIKDLLLHSRMTVTEIADQLGYHDLGYFSRFFSKHTGKSPRKYRVESSVV